MDIIQMTRELGKALQADDRYIAYNLAKQANDNDAQLQDLIGAFNLKRMELNMEMGKEDKSDEKIAELNETIRSMYQQIMSNPKMMAFSAAKEGMDSLMNQINHIITMAANGEDPETCGTGEIACSGNCSSCGGGCH
ncbi:MAG: YlbF family regulator [Ruminococcus sp.]|nr:YlbF family regulator [Ruminococcus sp.]MBQ7002716.1 YlbF family regulator [Oscillospiraceae bacterium]